MSKNSLVFLIAFFSGFILFSQSTEISEITFVGVKKIKTSFLTKVLSTKTSQQIDSIILEKDIKFLKRLPAVVHASYKTIHLPNGTYKIEYTIEESFTIIPLFNVYTSNSQEIAYRVGVSEYNFLGHSMILGGFYQKDIYNSYRISLQAPYLFSKKIGLGLSYQDFTSLEPVFFEQGTVDYKYNNTSFEVLAICEIDAKNRFSTGINIFTENYLYIEKEGDIAPPIYSLIEDKIMYKLIYQHDNLDYHYQYVSGFKDVFNFQYVNSETNVSSPDFFIAWNDFLYYRRVKSRGNFASRLRIGLSTNNDSPFAPFALDNNINIRGVGNIIDRGTGSIVLNTEFRYAILDTHSFCLQGNIFIDAGSWRNPGGGFEDFIQAKDVVVFSGPGLRFIHKRIVNAVFRIDYGLGLTEKTHGLVFGIGQYF